MAGFRGKLCVSFNFIEIPRQWHGCSTLSPHSSCSDSSHHSDFFVRISILDFVLRIPLLEPARHAPLEEYLQESIWLYCRAAGCRHSTHMWCNQHTSTNVMQLNGFQIWFICAEEIAFDAKQCELNAHDSYVVDESHMWDRVNTVENSPSPHYETQLCYPSALGKIHATCVDMYLGPVSTKSAQSNSSCPRSRSHLRQTKNQQHIVHRFTSKQFPSWMLCVAVSPITVFAFTCLLVYAIYCSHRPTRTKNQ